MKLLKIIVLSLFSIIVLSMIYNRFIINLFFERECLFVIGILTFLLFQKNKYISLLALPLYFYGIYQIVFVDSNFNLSSAYDFSSTLASTMTYYHLKTASSIIQLIPIIYYLTSIVLVFLCLYKQWKSVPKTKTM
jgi:hypothetical protein